MKAAGSHFAMTSHSEQCNSHLPAAEFFKDIPWLSVPVERRGNILVEPLYPRGRLLGGSANVAGKPSKLAALAAARKKVQRDEKSLGGTPQSNLKSGAKEQSSSIVLLDKLSLRNEREPSDNDESKPHASEERAVNMRLSTYQNQSRSNPTRAKKDFIGAVLEEATVSLGSIKTPEPDKPQLCDVRASPSTFAQTMFSFPSACVTEGRPFSLPRPSDLDLTNINPFAGPSPDDVVTKAQARGSIFG